MKVDSTTYPTGIIEGFYGKPWTDDERLTAFEWMQRCNLNTYVYAPKDDPKHRIAWRELYTTSDQTRLRVLISQCKRRKIRFCYAISPGLDITFSLDLDRRALKKKLSQVRSLGCDAFALLFDDIPASLSRADRKRFPTQASAQVSTANDIYSWLRQENANTIMFFCPTVYCGAMARPSVSKSGYLRELGENLDERIKVFWTGPDIISERIPIGSIRELATVLRRRPVLWDNLYANDYDMRRLHLGPYAGRPPELKYELGGAFLNPNCQFYANFVPVRTFASWLRNTGPANSKASWGIAAWAWFKQFSVRGPRKPRFADLRLLCEFFYLPTTVGPSARRFLADLRALASKPAKHWGNELKRFNRVCQRILLLFDTLMCLENRALLHSMYAHLWEIKERILLLQSWVRSQQANLHPEKPFVPEEAVHLRLHGSAIAELDCLIGELLGAN